MNILRLLMCLAFAPCCASIQDMTLEEKVGQLLMVHFNGKEANGGAQTLIQKVHVGSVIYYNWANGLESPEQVSSLSAGLQRLAAANRLSIPLLIAVDQEGGLVSRLNHGFTSFPGNMALGNSGDLNLAEAAAEAIGEELAAVGVNMNLAPVADVNNNQTNVIGIRSFGSSPKTVSAFAQKALDGYHKAGIITSLKHFPGHGDTKIDSHENLPIVAKTIDELEKNELIPFSDLCNQTDTIMTAHIMIPAIDPKNCATLSKSILSLLRNKLGFRGVIVSDSLVMEGVLNNCDRLVAEAAIRAFNAGCDILMLGGKQLQGAAQGFELSVSDIENIHRVLVEAVRTGRISEEKVNQSVSRILELKKRYDLSSSRWHTTPVIDSNHSLLAKKIADRSILGIRNNIGLPLHSSRIALIAPEIVRERINDTTLCLIGKTTRDFYFKSLNPVDEEIAAAQKLADESDAVIFCSYNAWKNPTQLALMKKLSAQKPMILIALRDSNDAFLLAKLPVIISTSSPTTPSIQAASDWLIH